MAARIALLLLPLIALTPGASAQARVSQTRAPEAVDAALRARVDQFFQYHVTGDYRKALALVAEDTQDAYFAQGKMKLKSFKLDSVEWLNDNFTKARVTLTVVRDWQIRMQSAETIIPMVTDWKIEEDKWVWYYDLKDRWLTPMGPSNIEPPKRNADGTVDVPKNLSAEIIAARARAILQTAGLDKGEIRLDAHAPSDRAIFTNSAQGPVGLSLDGVPEIQGFSARLDKNEVPLGGTAGVTISYASDTPREPFNIRLVTEPFNQIFNLRVVLGKQPDRQ